MSTNTNNIEPTYGLLRATEAMTNWRALVVSGLAGFAVLLSGYLTKNLVIQSGLLGFIGALFTIIIAFTGYSAIGILLMRRTQQQTISVADAIIQAVFTVPKLLGVALMMLIGVVGVGLLVLLILFVCKIPGLGSLLYAVVSPIVTVLLGVMIAGLLYVVFPLAAPAIWEGNSIWETTVKLLAIIRSRLMQVMINLIILSILVVILTTMTYLILSSGYSMTSILSSVVGINSLDHLSTLAVSTAMFGLGGGLGGGDAYGGAIVFAICVLFVIGAVIPLLTYINGTCLVYLQAIDGLHIGEVETQLREKMEDGKRRIKEAQEKVNNQMQQARNTQQDSESATKPRTCVNCSAVLAMDDAFCGECGTKHA